MNRKIAIFATVAALSSISTAGLAGERLNSANGGGLGGAASAYVGQVLGGSPGAMIGGGLGGAGGAVIANEYSGRHDERIGRYHDDRDRGPRQHRHWRDRALGHGHHRH